MNADDPRAFDAEAYRLLALNLIKVAMWDLGPSTAIVHQQSAREFFESESLAFWCELGGVDPDDVKDAAARRWTSTSTGGKLPPTSRPSVAMPETQGSTQSN